MLERSIDSDGDPTKVCSVSQGMLEVFIVDVLAVFFVAVGG